MKNALILITIFILLLLGYLAYVKLSPYSNLGNLSPTQEEIERSARCKLITSTSTKSDVIKIMNSEYGQRPINEYGEDVIEYYSKCVSCISIQFYFDTKGNFLGKNCGSGGESYFPGKSKLGK